MTENTSGIQAVSEATQVGLVVALENARKQNSQIGRTVRLVTSSANSSVVRNLLTSLRNGQLKDLDCQVILTELKSRRDARQLLAELTSAFHATKCTDIRFADRLDTTASGLRELADITPPNVKPAEGNASVMEAMNRLLVMIGFGGDGEKSAPGTENVSDAQSTSIGALQPTDRAALLVASLIDSGLLLFALLLPTDPLSGGFGGKHRPETVAEKLRQYALVRPEAFADVLELRFSKGGRHFIAQPDGQWLKTDDTELQDDLKPQRMKLRSLKTIVDHLEDAKLLRTCIIPNRDWWPWRGLVERARMTVNDAGWIERPDESGPIDPRQSRLHIFHAHLSDLNALVSLDHPAMTGQSNSHSAMDVSGLPSQYAGISRENSERINLILKIDEDIDRARRTAGFRESHVQNQLNQIFMLRQYLERSGIYMVGATGDLFDPKLHREARAAVDTTDFAPNTIIETVKPGFARVEQRGSSRGQLFPIVQAAVVRSTGAALLKPRAPEAERAQESANSGDRHDEPVRRVGRKDAGEEAPRGNRSAAASPSQDEEPSPPVNGNAEPHFKASGEHSLFDDEVQSEDDTHND